MSDYTTIIRKIQRGEPAFMKSANEGYAMRSIPGDGKNFFVKTPGADEYQISSETDLACEMLMEPEEITEKEYQNF